MKNTLPFLFLLFSCLSARSQWVSHNGFDEYFDQNDSSRSIVGISVSEPYFRLTVREDDASLSAFSIDLFDEDAFYAAEPYGTYCIAILDSIIEEVMRYGILEQTDEPGCALVEQSLVFTILSPLFFPSFQSISGTGSSSFVLLASFLGTGGCLSLDLLCTQSRANKIGPKKKKDPIPQTVLCRQSTSKSFTPFDCTLLSRGRAPPLHY